MDTDTPTVPPRGRSASPPRVFSAGAGPRRAETASYRAPVQFDWLLDRYRDRPGTAGARPCRASSGDAR